MGAKSLVLKPRSEAGAGRTMNGFLKEVGNKQDIETLLNIQRLRLTCENKIRSRDKNVEPETSSESLGHMKTSRGLSQAHLEKTFHWFSHLFWFWEKHNQQRGLIGGQGKYSHIPEMVDSELTEIWCLPEQTRDAEMEGSRITKSLEKYHFLRLKESEQVLKALCHQNFKHLLRLFKS